ncbi:sensor histidine kinase [Rhodoferax sp.]|uniref:sensor histidine kinase n=1 Tax=Rhodoferax sp. TaxID=50421 RepID=UPI0027319711|nr:HAMP domain-containing sensor histidine kinase [Rhodoferax sp.]MDP1531584.1 HAMP domain-containing sensor histidine kinase [Rhodoferax sp.]MDP1944141.1 HAMP domain-containing sensor histidine kinase [Rhodoferax sp.]MDP2441205.1 HAMP domain-containing sensor histidine kinase [Rhodoferax sp.]MDZ4209532.1 HAMP domain-containing sensor histidine kinase [Rhodoferax sp.]
MRLFDLSLQFKMPLWGGGLILATALALSISFVVQTWDNLHQEIHKNAQDIGRTMARSLFPVMLHDEVWQAFEIVSLPFAAVPSAALAESLMVLDSAARVYVSSRPEEHPMLSPLDSLGEELAELDRAFPRAPDANVFVLDQGQHIYVTLPIVNDGIRLGTLVVAYNKSLLWQRFTHLLANALWVTLLVLGVLLPITAYWGRRMMQPMRLITERISRIGSNEFEALDASLYPYKDEVGQLFAAYADMRSKLMEKAELEKEMIKSERMAAVGRLTASIAHEINNPLGGMLNAISTLKRFGSPDPVMQKTVSLLERGLSQVRDTVAALLVEAKVKSRALSPTDLEDVRILVKHAAKKLATELSWDIALPNEVALPSTLVRQVLINLLLNAITAAGQGGKVALHVTTDLRSVNMVIENNGKSLSPEQLGRLFEPFTQFSETGNGLGLWICYQIVTQLGGTIQAESNPALTRFSVSFPLTTFKTP